MSKTLLVDGPNLLMRAVMAMNRPGVALLSADGVSTGPLVAFINGLSRVVRDERPTHLVVCWDGPGDSWRCDLDPTYKANRVRPDPDSEFEQARKGSFDLAKQFCTLAGIHHVERPHIEADDLIAAYWRLTPGAKVIVSNDKDFLQLLHEDTELIRLSGGGAASDRWTLTRFYEERHYEPEHEALVMALTGDVSDNVPGLPRMGPKTAVKTLSQVERDPTRWTLAGLIQHPKVAPHAERVVLNHRLVNLRLVGKVASHRQSPLPPFRPTEPGHALYGPLLMFLTRYRLSSIEARLYARELWQSEEVPHG